MRASGPGSRVARRGLGKEPCVGIAGDDPLHVAVQAYGQVVGVAGRNQPQVGIAAEHEGGEAAGDEFALAVLRRHEDHQPPATARRYLVEFLGQFLVVPVGGVVRLGVRREGQQVLPCVPSPQAFKFGLMQMLGMALGPIRRCFRAQSPRNCFSRAVYCSSVMLASSSFVRSGSSVRPYLARTTFDNEQLVVGEVVQIVGCELLQVGVAQFRQNGGTVLAHAVAVCSRAARRCSRTSMRALASMAFVR